MQEKRKIIVYLWRDMGKEKNFKTKSMMKQKLHFQRVFASLLLLTISMLSWAYDFEVNGI